MSERLYFAYGSNINLTQMSFRCPAARVVSPAELDGYRLAFRASGVATVLPEKGSVVNGLLWTITEDCEINLDRYEGYPQFYGKEDVLVTAADGKEYKVMAYVMTEEFAKMPALPPRSYVDGICDGYVQNCMAIKPLVLAVRKAIRECLEQEKQISLFDAKKSPRHEKHSVKKKNRDER